MPTAYVKDGKIVLNVSMQRDAAAAVCCNDGIEFDARFGGVVHHVRVPMAAVLGIYARETGEGMVFNESEPEPPPAQEAGAAGGRPRVVTAPDRRRKRKGRSSRSSSSVAVIAPGSV